MQIFIKLYSGRSVLLNVNPSDTLFNIKCLLYEKEGLPIDLQKYTFEGRFQTDDDRTLEEIGVKEDSQLHLWLRGRPNPPLKPANVFVNDSTTGHTRGFGLDGTETVGMLKKLIADAFGMNPEDQRLLSPDVEENHGLILDDEKPLSTWGIGVKRRSILHLIKRVRPCE